MRLGVIVAALSLMAGCASQQGGALQKPGAPGVAQPSQLGETEVRYGRIARIDPVSLEGDHQLGVGHVLGAVAGGALGHQFGSGGGRMVAQVLGSVGGGYAGGAVQNKYPERRPGQHFTVTLASGVAVGVTQPAQAGLQVGDCVRIDGSGQTARVVRADCMGAQAVVAAPPRAPSQGDAFRDELRERVRERMEAERAAATAPAAPEPARPLGESQIRFGRIVRIDSVTLQGEHEVGLEGVMNGVSGAALGDPVPGGDGRAFADVANALGSVSARTSEIKYASPQPGELISVKLDNGVAVGILQPVDAELRVGDRVRIDGAGPKARVMRA